MQPGERVTLIKAIAGKLSEQSLTDAALTLREFGVSYDEDWRGGLYEMALDALPSAPDDTLIALNAHLDPDASAVPASTSGGPWDQDAFRLFVSHTHAHRGFAGQLRASLRRVGIDAFVAHDAIGPTSEWRDVVESALRTCDALIAILTPDFIESEWCDQEVGFCVARSVLVVPLRMPDSPHGFIGIYQGLTLGEAETGYTAAPRLFDLLASHELTRRRMVRPVITRYVRSGSFQNTRDVFPLLTAIPNEAWTAQMVEDVLSAARHNTQIEHANLVPSGRPVPEATREHLERLGLLQAEPRDDDIPF
jgi:hypothetical protein